MEQTSITGNETNLKVKNDKYKVKATLFFTSLAGISALIGFSRTLAVAKRHDTKYFNEGISGSPQMKETGASLALRALGWGTLYSFAGCGLLFYGIWKLSGAENFEEFRLKMQKILPEIPKNNPPKGRTEFSGINDLLEYLSEQKSAKDE